MTEKQAKRKPKKEAVKEKPSVSEEPEASEDKTSEDKTSEDKTSEDILGETTGVLGEAEEIADERILKKKVRVGIEEEREEEHEILWVPRTELGKKVHTGEITSIQEITSLSLPIKEVEIVDKLLPNLQEEIINVGRVQRATDSGRRTRFRVVAAVGNNNGIVGVGISKGKEAGPTIRKAIERAKLNITEIKRGCGSWECGCGKPHTVPFKVTGKAGSIKVELRPAPRGVGLVTGETAKSILSLAGITDGWVTASGHTRTGINFALAVFHALIRTNYTKVGDKETSNLNIVSGSIQETRNEVNEDASKEEV